jgi:hypothetical protein
MGLTSFNPSHGLVNPVVPCCKGEFLCSVQGMLAMRLFRPLAVCSLIFFASASYAKAEVKSFTCNIIGDGHVVVNLSLDMENKTLYEQRIRTQDKYEVKYQDGAETTTSDGAKITSKFNISNDAVLIDVVFLNDESRHVYKITFDRNTGIFTDFSSYKCVVASKLF